MHDPGPPPRTRNQLLWRSPVGALALGKIFSTLAVWTTNIAAAILVYDLTRSALLVGLVSAAQFLPQLVLTPFSGALADRSDRLLQVIAGTGVTALGSVLLVTWGSTVGFTRPADAGAAIAAAGLVGTGFSIAGPATSSLLPALVRRSELADAIALSSLPIVIARAIGPAVGALLFLTLGPTGTFAIASLLHLGFITTLLVLRRRVGLPERQPSTGDRRIRAGLAYLRSSPRTVLTLIGVGTIGIGVDPVTTLMPALAASLGQTSQFVGTLASSFGVGAGVGFVVLSRARLAVGIDRLGSFGLAMMGVGLVIAATVGVPAATLVGIGLSGAGMSFSLNAFTTLVQAQVPDDLRGRVMALWAMAFLGTRPLTSTTTGWLTDLTDVRIALLTSAALVLTGAAVTRGARLVRAALPPVTGEQDG
jgi:MFS family permease